MARHAETASMRHHLPQCRVLRLCRETPKFCDSGVGGTDHKGEGCRKNLAKRKHFAISFATNLSLSLPCRSPLVLVGYARVSTDDRNLTLQRAARMDRGTRWTPEWAYAAPSIATRRASERSCPGGA